MVGWFMQQWQDDFWSKDSNCVHIFGNYFKTSAKVFLSLPLRSRRFDLIWFVWAGFVGMQETPPPSQYEEIAQPFKRRKSGGSMEVNINWSHFQLTGWIAQVKEMTRDWPLIEQTRECQLINTMTSILRDILLDDQFNSRKRNKYEYIDCIVDWQPKFLLPRNKMFHKQEPKNSPDTLA